MIWQIAETIHELQKGLIASTDEWAEYAAISHPQKQLEWLAGRRAMQSLVQAQGLNYEGMTKDLFGKPHLTHRVGEISLTHTVRFVGVVWHESKPVGMDLERVSEKLARVAPKFLSDTEKHHAQESLTRLTTYWCAKEALYKLYGAKELSFKKEIVVSPFADDVDILEGEIHPTNAPSTFHRLYRLMIEDFCGVVAL